MLARSARAVSSPVPPPSLVAQSITLKQGAEAGIVHLASKGLISGDTLAVDLEGVRIPGAPITAIVRIEFSGADATVKAAEIEAAVEGHLAGMHGTDGTP